MWVLLFHSGANLRPAGSFCRGDCRATKSPRVVFLVSPTAELARVYALAGRAAEARKALADLLAAAKRQYVPKYTIATVYAAMADKDQALAQLEQAYQDRSSWFAFMKVDPEVDSLRSDPRFQDLMRRMNFPP